MLVFGTVTILAIAYIIGMNYTLSKRVFTSPIFIKPNKKSYTILNWLLPFLFIFFIISEKDLRIFFLSCLFLQLASIAIEWYFFKKQSHISHFIEGNTLVENNFKIRQANLEELVIVDFKPWGDFYCLKFVTDSSIYICREQYDKNILNDFVKEAIKRSKLTVLISDETSTKLSLS